MLAVGDRRRRGGDRRLIDGNACQNDFKNAFERALFSAFDRPVERPAGDYAERAYGTGAGQRDRRFHHGRVAVGPDQIDVNFRVGVLAPQQRQADAAIRSDSRRLLISHPRRHQTSLHPDV